jgi:EAL and modified HD-GYP domain-containing signal transduction protein
VPSSVQLVKFLARQPILDSRGDVFAYELLFRASDENSYGGANPDMATSSLLDTSFLMGFQRLTGGRRAFINCPRDFLLGNSISLFPQDQVVVEVLENVKLDGELIAACARLKRDDYLVALDDFVDAPEWAPLVELADFIKVDFRLTSPAERKKLAARYGSRGVRMIAEKVETREEFAEACRIGYSLFQGYFFCQPEVLQHQGMPSSKMAYLDLLQASVSPEFDLEVLASKIKHDPSLTFRLLRYLNSVIFGLRTEIRSVQHALTLLGQRELRKWIAVVCIAVLGDGKPDELMILPLVRGRFCELLAPSAGMATDTNDLFFARNSFADGCGAGPSP